MAHINLLPWRESLRQQQKKQYISAIALIAVLVFLVMYLIGMFIESLIAGQNQRNQFMEQQIAVLDAEIAKIRDIKESKKAIEQRMALIEQLQTSRNVAPIILDELARMVPPGISFRGFTRSGNRIEVRGVSESNNRLADFMRRLENSTVFTGGELSSIVADTSAPDAVSEFNLTFNISSRVAPDFTPVEAEKKK